jgi:putative ABC transport system permease protein
MLKTYIKLAFRGLIQNRVFSFINVFGLAIGLTCCLLITLYIHHEFSYDTQHQNGRRLYQVGSAMSVSGEEVRSASTSAPMAKALQQEYPEIQSTARLMPAFEDDKTLLQYRQGKDLRSFYEPGAYFADSTFFQMFTYRFREGDPRTALQEPNSVVLSEEIARKLFGREPALNKTLHINSTTNGAHDFKVTGVFMPSKTPSHIDARFFLSFRGGSVGEWVNEQVNMSYNNMFYTYLLLKPGAEAPKLDAKLPAFVDKYMGADLKASGRQREQFLTAVPDIHLYANTDRNVTEGGSVRYLFILMSIAIVTILIACVNFMNLSTARSSKRAVEIGVRKVLGAERKALVRQFLWEAILLALVAFTFSILFAVLLLPLFEQVSGKQFLFSAAQIVYLGLGFLAITLAAGFVAGIYPAFYLSAFKPVKVLKGRFSNSLGAVSFRRVLVVFQFVISVGLIVASATISNQLRYLRQKDLGFEKDQQVIVPLRTSTAKAIYPALKDQVQASPGVSGAGASIYYPGITNFSDWLLYKQGTTQDETRKVYINHVDHSYLQTLGVRPVAGRLFSAAFPADTANRMVLNEEAIRQFGFGSPRAAIGKNLVANWGGEEAFFEIVGVVKDFHFKELRSQIEAYGFLLNRSPEYNYLVAHVKGGDMKAALGGIGAAWRKLNPNEPFEYSFLDEDFQKNYQSEERLAAIIRYFTIVAIFISCLGLFGLTTFSVEQRTKEIGIRKVLGASTAGIVSLLSKDFLKLVLLSFLVASPLAWYFMHNWLQNFAYKAPFSIWVILVGWGIAFLIAFLTISIQAVRVALTNPVKNLRTE